MHRKQGFTLVELLVVMAIIAILASIVVPNVTRYIRKARATAARTEIMNMDMQLTSILADANVSSLNHLFDPNEVQGFLFDDAAPIKMANWGTADFERAQHLYTNTFYALLRLGRGALSEPDPDFPIVYSAVLKESAVRKLGDVYLEIGLDSWGNRYEIFPGGWPSNANAPIPFRTFIIDQEELDLPGARRYRDTFQSAYTDGATNESFEAGYAASKKLKVYIYSKGENKVSGQMVFPTGGYDLGQESEYTCGGDDINNWDKKASYMRFYN